MRYILPGIKTLAQHIQQLITDPNHYRPKQCATCGKSGLWCHGTYGLKADRENPSTHSLNPILIPRFYCPSCYRTCSVLPECIPPRRWYLWAIQQATLLAVFLGKSIYHSAREHLPSRFTVSRWFNRLVEQFHHHRFHLSAHLAQLGYTDSFEAFWQACFQKLNLSGAMCLLNQAGVVVP